MQIAYIQKLLCQHYSTLYNPSLLTRDKRSAWRMPLPLFIFPYGKGLLIFACFLFWKLIVYLFIL